MKRFSSVEAAIRYLERTFVQNLSDWEDKNKWCSAHNVSHKFFFGCTVTGNRFGFDTETEVIDWASKLAYGPGGTDQLWPHGVAPDTGLG